MRFRRSRLIAGLALVLGISVGHGLWIRAESQGMHAGMMGGGMMGGVGPRNQAPREGDASNPELGKLTSYVRSNGLACMRCHTLSGRFTGPAFVEIARRFAGQRNAADEIAGAIHNAVAGQWPGHPPMPAGLATPTQAKTFAELILHLAH